MSSYLRLLIIIILYCRYVVFFSTGIDTSCNNYYINYDTTNVMIVYVRIDH